MPSSSDTVCSGYVRGYNASELFRRRVIMYHASSIPNPFLPRQRCGPPSRLKYYWQVERSLNAMPSLTNGDADTREVWMISDSSFS